MSVNSKNSEAMKKLKQSGGIKKTGSTDEVSVVGSLVTLTDLRGQMKQIKSEADRLGIIVVRSMSEAKQHVVETTIKRGTTTLHYTGTLISPKSTTLDSDALHHDLVIAHHPAAKTCFTKREVWVLDEERLLVEMVNDKTLAQFVSSHTKETIKTAYVKTDVKVVK